MLDLEKDKIYIIHQILAYGDVADIKWLLTAYPKNTIDHVFTTTPYKDYRKSRFHFVKNMIVGSTHQTLSDSFYVKNTPRNI